MLTTVYHADAADNEDDDTDVKIPTAQVKTFSCTKNKYIGPELIGKLLQTIASRNYARKNILFSQAQH